MLSCIFWYLSKTPDTFSLESGSFFLMYCIQLVPKERAVKIWPNVLLPAYSNILKCAFFMDTVVGFFP